LRSVGVTAIESRYGRQLLTWSALEERDREPGADSTCPLHGVKG
jgi:hypothetical protein